MVKEYWLIDSKMNKIINYFKGKNLREAERVFFADAEMNNYSVRDCV